jgi:hypothetical protein
LCTILFSQALLAAVRSRQMSQVLQSFLFRLNENLERGLCLRSLLHLSSASLPREVSVWFCGVSKSLKAFVVCLFGKGDC